MCDQVLAVLVHREQDIRFVCIVVIYDGLIVPRVWLWYGVVIQLMPRYWLFSKAVEAANFVVIFIFC